MLRILNAKLRRLCRRLRWPLYRRRRRDSPKVVIQKLGKSDPSVPPTANGSASAVHPNYGHSDVSNSRPPPTKTTVRIATFNAAFFSMAPAVPQAEKSSSLPSSFDFDHEGLPLTPTAANKANNNLRAKSANLDRPKSILKQSSSPCPLHPINGADHLTKQQKFARSKLRVSINLPDNEISLLRNRRRLSFGESEIERGRDSESHNPPSSSVSRIFKGKAPLRSSSSSSLSFYGNGGEEYDQESARRQFQYRRSVVEVLRELDADIIALQEVKAEEEREMKPLSDLAAGLGMNYAFAESWAPEYGNAVLSKWPIKRWRVQKIFDDSDFRNVLKATIDVPQVGEVNLHCTHLDHLDENWRMKQINSIIQSSDDRTHILAGGLNSLDETDYSHERWTDIVKYYEEIGKPTPKVEVMRFLKNKQYTDAKDFAGECESVVVIAKGQSVQGTCKYGTRVDYILASPECPYKFVPGSYAVLSSKGTSDHHIVKVDVVKADDTHQQQDVNSNAMRKRRRRRQQEQQKVVKITSTTPPSKGIWKT